jgi:hypothetical protein
MNVEDILKSELEEERKGRRRKIYTKPLTSEEFKILTKVANDPFEFAKHVWVVHPKRGKTKFNLFPYQLAVLAAFIKFRFNIVKKFRQAGLTELIAMFCLWMAMYHSHKNINIVSIKDITAKKVLRRIKFMYRNLPDFLKVSVVNGRSGDLGTASEIEFSNGSIISSIPTTEEAGRSEALSLLVIDEAAIIRWADQIWAAAFPTLSTGGRAILNSTPYGTGNFFHKQWVAACSGGVFNPVNLRWQMHPERDRVWYDEMAKALGPRRTAQEIDGDFLTSGNNVFDLIDIRAIEESLNEYTPIDWRHDDLFKDLQKDIRPMGEHLRIFNYPDPRKKYAIGADVATGRARDYSAFTLFDQSGEEQATFKMKLPTNEYKNLLGKIGMIFNQALIAPESNDIGLAITSGLQEMSYPNLYYSTQLVREKGEKKPKEQKIPGWYTTLKNRPTMISELEEDIRLNNVLIKDPDFVQEAYTFIYDDRNRAVAQGKGGASSGDEDPLAEDGYTDDTIFGKAIGNHIRKIKQRGLIILPV